MKPWEADAIAAPDPAGDVPPGGLGVDVPIQRGFQVSPADQAIRDEAARRLREKEAATPKPWEMDAPAPEPTKGAMTTTQALPKTRSLLEQAAYEVSPEGLKQSVASGYVQNALNLASSIPAQALGGLTGLATLATGGGLDKAVGRTQKVSEALTYQPVTKAAQDQAAAIAYPFEKANEGLGYVGEMVGGEAGRTVGENIIPVAGTLAPVPKVLRRARAQAEAGRGSFPVVDEATGKTTYYPAADVAAARQNAAMLDAHEAARRMGIVTDPAKTNPTAANVRRSSFAGEHLTNRLAEANEPKWNAVIREDVGIAPDMPLNMNTILEVRGNAAVPMEAIAREGGQMLARPEQIDQIRALRRESTIASPEIASQTDHLINRAVQAVEEGADASQLLREIADLRSDANKFFEATGGGPEMAAKAKAYKQIANLLEEIVQDNLTMRAMRDPYGKFQEMAAAYPEARRTMAKSYVLEGALDLNTQKIDPTKLAKLTADDNALTGAFADVGKVVGNFPEATKAASPEQALLKTRVSRYSLPGIVGAGAGTMLFGAPTVGAALGVGANELATRLMARRTLLPKVQERGVNPVPRSLWDLSGEDPLISRYNFGRDPEIFREFGAAPEGGAPMLPPPAAPPGPRGPLDNPPAPYTHPNFQFGDNNPPGPRQPGTGVVPSRPLTPEEQWAQDKGNFAAQDRVRYERESAMDALAQQRAEAEAAALRRPATGEQLLNLNPMTGRLESASRGLPGATPEVVRSTGSSLEGAAKKLAEGRAFAMTPEEKIAWKHTQTSLTEQVPELRGMSEKQVFERMRDRQWIADTIQKLREKDIAFEGIRRTADENAARAEAAKQREILADRLEEMQAQFDAMPERQTPKSQGPKTREFQRAQINALRNKE